MNKIIDLSRIIEDEMPVYPGDKETSLVQVAKVEEDGYSSYTLSSGMHAGTHVDAPQHLLAAGKSVCDYPLDRFMGKAKVIDVRNRAQISYLQYFNQIIYEGDIILFYTGWAKSYTSADYYTKHPVLTQDLADFLVRRKVKLVGIDSPSPDYEPFPIHKTLLKHNILIIENLCNLDKLLSYPKFEIIAFPLKIKAEASLVRVAAIIEDEE